MATLLLSWIAFNNDFTEGKVNRESSPNYQMHKHFWKYDKHLLLSSSREDDIRMQVMLNTLANDFPDHLTESVYMDIQDVIGLEEIKVKIEDLLLSLKDHILDIFFSPGTSVMQLSWFICHTSLGLDTRLLQMRPARKSTTNMPELLEIKHERSQVPFTSIIKEKNLEQRERDPGTDKGIKIIDALKPIYDKAMKIAQTDKVTALITGETGTGKERLARFIHDESVRKDKPYLAVNCSAFNDSLLESRLFGYKKGAFTGALADTKGVFELANGGTIFLDEIGDISPYMQQSLLRVFQEKEIQPVGGTVKKVDVRIIAATNKDLVSMCENKTFRWDLYYRLAVAELELPSLQEMSKKDMKELLEFIIKKKKKELRKAELLNFDKESFQMLLSYGYPGNIREMENIIESLYVFGDAAITPAYLPARMRQTRLDKSLRWQDIEKTHIEYVLSLKKGNQRQAWLALGYGSLNTFKKKLKEYGIAADL